ncbi:hypothetical protein ERO13_D09G116700v2 [Gossypium hirsutum]|uniref:Uncharacterized protein isoform X2 n=1 Tax=Gossypium hirsutum TaxID=3635 RepID=A0A1U8I5T7_GOSHI|nr:uncharacterized protein LOC107891329 isoform X2 [Gossypium hirsutum]KAG4130033.1 hypothetical protein ERO13_D09G116700v2 [Gossypium hirsutum]
MSPAAVEFRSQDAFSTNAKPSSTPQNPEPTPHNFTAFPHSNHSQKNLGNAGEFDCGFGFDSSSGFHSKSAARLRPRLLKVRKQFNGKVKTGECEVESGFNPFKQSGQGSRPVGTIGNPSSSESMNRVNDDNSNNNIGDNNNSSFVFGANSGSDRESSGHAEVKNRNEEPLGKFENVGFVFGADLRGGMEKLGSEKCEQFGFVFGANGSDGRVKLNPEKGESSDSSLSLDGCEGKIKLETGLQGSNNSNLDFTFGSSKSNLASNLDLEKPDFGGTLKVPDFCAAGFVFGSSQSDLKPTFSSHKIEPTNVVGEPSSTFGASNLNSSSFILERRSGENLGQPICSDFGKMNMEGETRSQKMEPSAVNFNANGSETWTGNGANSFFVFGATSYKSSSNECKDGINSSSEKFGVSARNVQYKDAFESGNCFGSSSWANSVFILELDLEKLNISSSKNIGGTNSTKDSDTEANPEATFLFGNVNGAASCNKNNVGISDSEPFTFQAGIDKTSDIGNSFQGHVKDDLELNGTDAWSSLNLNSQVNTGVINAASVGTERNDENCSIGTLDQSEISSSDFRTPKWNPSSFKENLFPEVDRKLEFGEKISLTKEKRSKKMRGKSRKSSLHKHWSEQYNVPQESSPQENQDSSQCYSPMDFSPYREIAEVDQLPKESAQDEGDQKCSKPNEENFGYDHQRTFFGDGPSREPVCESETAPTAFRSDCFSSSSAAGIAGAEGLNGTQENKQRTESCFSSGMQDERKFTFSATSTSGQGSLSLRKRQLRNQSKVKIGNASFIITPVLDVQGGSSSVQFSPCDPVECEQKDKFTHHSKEENDQFKQRSNSFTAAVHEACEMWRLRGNQAYRNENLSKAEEFYTQGINSVATNETSGCSVKPLVLCYSNRAATRISLGRIREALADCLMAAAFDPNFLKVNVRAGNCYLLLGETDNAIRYFNKCFSSGADVCLDRRIRVDAADGLQKAQRVDELTKHSAMLLEEKSSNAASSALDAISEALSISSRSEKLLEMKAEALYMLKRYEEAIQLCEQPLYVAENSSSEAEIDKQITSTDGCGCYSIAMLWRWNLMSKSYFYMGKLEKALELLQKLEHVGSWKDKHGSKILEMSVSLAVTIRELLRLKTAGNEAVCSGRYTEAVEHYSLALSSNVESRPFAAICFCNRAAAHQALGQIADAIADCSLAMALNENYTKAVSRRATLHEMIRDYGQASSDLQRLISILEKQCDKTSHQSGTKDKSTGNLKELRQAQRRLSSMQEEAKREIPLNLYLILGVKPSDSTSDVKKAYRKAALRHHPDKAGQFLARSETGDEGQLWKEIAEEIHKGADRLFKMIGEAYAVLSDTEKRSEYDLEEEIRKAPNKSKSNAYERARDDYGYHYERSSSRRYWRGNWNDYRNSHSRW